MTRPQLLTSRRCHLLIASVLGALALGACGSDDEPTGGSDAGLDGSGTTDPACEGSAEPQGNAACSCEGESVQSVDDSCTTSCVCSAGFWDCADPSCSEPLVPELEFAGDATLNEVTGNDNGVPNPGETWSVTGSVRILNAGTPEDVTVQLRSISTRLNLEDATVQVTGVGAEAAEYVVEFEIQPSATEGTAPLTVEAFTEGGFDVVSQELVVDVETVPTAVLTLAADDLDEVTGNGDRFVDPGETWTLPVTLRNTGDAAASDIDVEAVPSSGTLTALQTSSAPGTLAAGATATVNVQFTVAAAPTDFEPAISLTATSSNASTASTSAPVAVRPADTLSFVSSVISQIVGAGNDDTVADNDENWQVAITIENTGTVDLQISEWRLNNYFIPDLPGEGSTDGSGEGSAEGSGETEPDYSDLKFTLREGAPSTIEAGAEVTVFAETRIEAEMGNIGRIIVTLQSTLRRHGPFAVDVPLSRP
jgi:uncharacterized repeat protein (TIGR01451 family)